jgi:hypothetical protein
MCLRDSYKKKIFVFESLQSLKKGVGSISQRYGSARIRIRTDPDPHQNVTDPQHCMIFGIFVVLMKTSCSSDGVPVQALPHNGGGGRVRVSVRRDRLPSHSREEHCHTAGHR